jgi:hypothetical protein
LLHNKRSGGKTKNKKFQMGDETCHTQSIKEKNSKKTQGGFFEIF